MDQNEEREIKLVLKSIISQILSATIGYKEIQKRAINELDTKNVWESNCMLITDCYFAIKHCAEEEITTAEWRYLLDCLNGVRKYRMEDKVAYINNFIRGRREGFSSESLEI